MRPSEHTYEVEDDVLDDVTEDDYVFIVGPEGNLKSIVLPENYSHNSMSESIKTLIKSFGVTELHTQQTLH
jgi:hypothetical protein